jgi:hypothetical protein
VFGYFSFRRKWSHNARVHVMLLKICKVSADGFCYQQFMSYDIIKMNMSAWLPQAELSVLTTWIYYQLQLYIGKAVLGSENINYMYLYCEV